MTIDQAIGLCDALQPNQYPRELKCAWLETLDGRLFRELLGTHADCPQPPVFPYDPDTDGERELLVPAPYDQDVYCHFLQSRIHRENGETARYNQAVTLYNSAFRAYAQDYHRTHLPLQQGGGFRL